MHINQVEQVIWKRYKRVAESGKYKMSRDMNDWGITVDFHGRIVREDFAEHCGLCVIGAFLIGRSTHFTHWSQAPDILADKLNLEYSEAWALSQGTCDDWSSDDLHQAYFKLGQRLTAKALKLLNRLDAEKARKQKRKR